MGTAKIVFVWRAGGFARTIMRERGRGERETKREREGRERERRGGEISKGSIQMTERYRTAGSRGI
jgi:hypothetical protein